MSARRNDKMQDATKSRKRGRPRAFDAGAAVLAAQRTFERKGYAATSLDDLCGAMKISRPSLYAAFESKQALYKTAMQAYTGHMTGLFAQALQQPGFANALRALYAVALDAYIPASGKAVGCMVACTAVTEAVDNAPIKASAKSILDGVDQLLAQRIARAVADGDLPASTRPQALSRLTAAMLHSLAMRARAGTSRRVLDEMADDAVAMLAPARPR